MTISAVYLWGVGIGTAVGVVLGWRKGMPLLSNHRGNAFKPADAIELVVTMLCFAFAWPYLLALWLLGFWKGGRRA
jgi:hypothetical protein